jgi:Transglutaminase-like superfamily
MTRSAAERRPAATLPSARRLKPIERVRLAGEIAIAYVQARRELRRAPIDAVVATLRSRITPCAAPHAPDTLWQARRLGRAVARVLGLLPGDTRCLVRSLVLTRLLARRGIDSKLVIGTRSMPDFLAHAWIEYEGEPVLSAGGGSFARLVEL